MKRLAIAVIGALAASVLIYAGAYLYFHYLAYGRSDTCREMTGWSPSTAPGTRAARHMGLAWRAGLLYVTDAENGIVERYRRDGTLESRWSGFRRPVAVAPTDTAVYVADFLADRVGSSLSTGRRSVDSDNTGAGQEHSTQWAGWPLTGTATSTPRASTTTGFTGSIEDDRRR